MADDDYPMDSPPWLGSKEYEPHTLTDADSESLRTLISLVRKDNGWATRLEQAMDSADYWRSRASNPTTDDSELQGELDLCRESRAELTQLIKASWDVLHANGVQSGKWLNDAVQQLADALTAERAKSAALQHALETTNAANARRAEESQLLPVGFIQRQVELGSAFLTYDGKPAAFEPVNKNIAVAGQFVKDGERCRVYLGPAEPLEVTP